MSFMTNLRASTSTSCPTIRISSLRIHHKPLITLTLTLRYATTSSNPSKTSRSRMTVQESEKQLADIRRRAEVAERAKVASGIDFPSMAIPILETVTEPRVRMTDWFRAPFSKAGRTYLKERAIFKDGTPYGQLGMTYQHMPEMERLKAYEHLDTKRFSLLSFRKRWIPTVRAKHVIDTVEEIYIEFHQVQARRDERGLRQLSLGGALTHGLAVVNCPPKLSSSWELVRWNGQPKLMWARFQPLDIKQKHQVAQVCVRFDSNQRLVFVRENDRSVEKRVLDHYVFERMLPPTGPWRIKERVETTLPAFLAKSAEEKGALQLAKNDR